MQPNLTNFNQLADSLFQYQKKNNLIFTNYIHHVAPALAATTPMPFVFLPVVFFKTHEVKTGLFTPEQVFTSSATTGMVQSKHFVKSIADYETAYLNAFTTFYGLPGRYHFLFLLPGYLERNGSSLVEMAKGLWQKTNNKKPPFYLNNFAELYSDIQEIKEQGKPIFLLGVTHALLDFATQYPIDLSTDIVMETGGMKGKREELTREEVHGILTQKFKLQQVHSEYGMTELLSQAYAKQNGRYHTPPWMKIIITDRNDPFTPVPNGKAGIINVIDLMNIDSCAFIQTQDLGRMHNDGSFEVLGRLDFSEARGCNLMYD